MNGRCTADPLDHADDICDFCGDEFCSSCLIATRKGKGPLVCRECAIDNSGIKGSRPTKPRVTKAQVNKARAALAEAKDTRTAKSFHFFDEEEGYVSPEVEISDEDDSDRDEIDEGRTAKRRFSLRRKQDDAPASTDDDLDEVSDLLDAIDEEPTLDPIDEPTPVEQGPQRRSTPATALIESGGLARLSAGESLPSHDPMPHDEPHDLVDDEPAPPAKSSTPGPPSLADRLRTTAARPTPSQTPTQSYQDDDRASTSPSAPSVDFTAAADPTPATVTRWVTDPAPTPQPAAAMDLDSDPFASPDFGVEVTTPQADVATPSIDLSFPTSTRHADTGASFEWQQPATPVDENLSDDPFGASTAPSPTVEPASVEPIRAEPAPVPAEAVRAEAPQAWPDPTVVPEPPRDVWPTDVGDVPTPPAGTNPAVAPIQSSAPVPAPQPTIEAPAAVEQLAPASSPGHVAVSDDSSSPSADTDANGNWIPPVLRGMAPVVERRADPLPRRRQHD